MPVIKTRDETDYANPDCLDHFNPYLNREVVVMEDDLDTSKRIQEIIERDLSWKVYVVNNADDAVKLAENRCIAFYILDINLGRGSRTTEGFNALERIKDIDKGIFVSIFSAHYSKVAERQAAKLGANVFQRKTQDARNDVRAIAFRMLQYMYERAEAFQKQISEQLTLVKFALPEKTATIDFITSASVSDSQNKFDSQDKIDLAIDSDENVIAFEKYRTDETWLNEHEGCYVAFVKGQLVQVAKERRALLNWLRTSEYKEKPRFVTKVEAVEKVINLPRSLDMLID